MKRIVRCVVFCFSTGAVQQMHLYRHTLCCLPIMLQCIVLSFDVLVIVGQPVENSNKPLLLTTVPNCHCDTWQLLLFT